MYNLLVTGEEGAWDALVYEFERERFGEATFAPLLARFVFPLSSAAIEELRSFPALFAYEGREGFARVGYIRQIKERTKSIRITYDFDSNISAIPVEKIWELKKQLDIQDFEIRRTHWAIKDEDLLEVLFSAGLTKKKVCLLNTIPAVFIRYAASILADTTNGLSGSNIIDATASYALDYEVKLPHPAYPFGPINKKTALYDNLMAFSPSQQYKIIKELCDHSSFSLVSSSAGKRKELKVRLITQYGHLDPQDTPSEINETLIEETRHWLESYPDALSLYSEALEKYKQGAFYRNLLDDLRLSLEKLLRSILNNSKSLENQIPDVGKHIKTKAGSVEMANMFVKLLEYYAKYNNTYIKHDNAVVEQEIEFIIEITSSFMKYLVRVSCKS